MQESEIELCERKAYLTSCSIDKISAGLDKSTMIVLGGLARVKPVPTT